MDVSKLGGSNELVQKWAKALDGIKNEYTARVTAQLLENQAKAVLAESNRINEDALSTGATTVGNIGTFQKFAFPLVRRVYPNLVFNYIGSTQPMDSPVSQVFYLGNSRFKGTAQQVMYSKFNLTPLGLTTSPIGSVSSPTALTGTPPTSGYNFANFGTALDLSSLIRGNAGSPSTTFGGKLASWPDAQTTLGYTVSAGERLDTTGIPEVQFHIEQQPVVARTRKMRALWTIEAAQDLKAYHNLDLEKELTELLTKELTLEIDRELIEDIRMIAYGIDVSAPQFGGWYGQSLDSNKNSNNFQDEYGKLFVTGTNTPGVIAEKWQPGSFSWGNTDAAFTGAPTARPSNVMVVDLASFLGVSYSPQHVGHRYANLLGVINAASQDIYKTTLRGPGTVLITSPLIASMLESAAKLEGGLAEKDGPTNMGTSIEYKGKFAGKYELIVDPLFPEDEIIIGYNGGSPMDSGFVYCPYIPLMPLPMVTDPGTFQPRKGIMTRYAKTAIQPANRFYRVIRLVGATSNYLTADSFKQASIFTPS